MENKDNISIDEKLELIFMNFEKAFKLQLPLAEAQEKVLGKENAFTQIAANIIQACIFMFSAGSEGSQNEKAQAFLKDKEENRGALNTIFDFFCDKMKRAVEFHNNEANKK